MIDSSKIDPADKKAKRGPKPIGERPLTPAERKKRSREKQASSGSSEFMIRLNRGTMNLVDQIAKASNTTRSEIIEQLLDMALGKVAIAIAEAEQLSTAGASENQVAAKLHEILSATPRPALVEKYKEVRGL